MIVEVVCERKAKRLNFEVLKGALSNKPRSSDGAKVKEGKPQT